jgi:membrane protein
VQIRGVDVVATAKAAFKEFREDDLQGRAAEVAYNVIFSVVPLLIFLTALSGFIARAIGRDDVMQDVTEWLFDHMGTDAAQAVQEPIERVIASNNGGLLSFGAVLALWGGKNAMASIMKALNTAFDVTEGRPWYRKYAVAVGLTIALGVALVLASTIFLAGAGVAENAMDRIGFGETWQSVWSILRWPVIAAILSLAIAALYWAAPNVDVPFKWLTPGSVWTVVVWGLATVGLGFYFANFAGYAGSAYGALGGVLAFLFWVYLMTLILLFGAEINAAIAARAAEPEPAPAEFDRTKAPQPGDETSSPNGAAGARGVPRGTYTPNPAARAFAGAVARSAVTTIASSLLRAVRQVRRLRSYASSRDAMTGR